MSLDHVHRDLPPAARADDNLTAMLWERAATHDPNDVYRHWRDGAWRAMTWVEVASRVHEVAAGLVALGVGRGDRVAVASRTCLDWTLADLAILSAGAVTVPLAATATAQQCATALHATGARLAITGTVEQASRVPGLAGRVFVFDEGGLDTIAALADDASRSAVHDRVAETGGDDVATIVDGHTLTHGGLLSAARRSALALQPMLGRSDTVLLCTPLADGFARQLQFLCLEANVTVAFARSPDTVLDDLASFGPTVLPATAEIFGRLVATVAPESSGPRAKAFDFAVASAVHRAGRADPSTLDTVRRTIADRLVYRDLRDAMGGQVRYGLVTGPPLAPRVAAVLGAAGVTIVDGATLAKSSAPAMAGAVGARTSSR
jgi:long-chain acyl-CoA synthetase